MKVLLLAFSHPEYTVQLANALSEYVEIKLLLSERIYNEKLIINNKVQVYLFNNPRIYSPYNFIPLFNILLKILDYNPSVIHIESSSPWLRFIMPILRLKYKIVTTVHDPKLHVGEQYWYTRLMGDNSIKNSSAFFVHGLKMKKLLSETRNIAMNKITSIPHGNYLILGKLKKNNIIPIKNSVLFFGRIREYKGLEYLIESVYAIKKKIPDIKIIIAGEGLIPKNNIIEENLNTFVIHNYRISLEDVPKFFQMSKIVVLPYIDASQSGVVPLAYSMKKPVIVTQVGSIDEFVVDGVTGFIVPPKDSQKLSEKIIELLENESLIQKMGENAYLYAKDEMSWDKIAKKTISVYGEIFS